MTWSYSFHLLVEHIDRICDLATHMQPDQPLRGPDDGFDRHPVRSLTTALNPIFSAEVVKHSINLVTPCPAYARVPQSPTDGTSVFDRPLQQAIPLGRGPCSGSRRLGTPEHLSSKATTLRCRFAIGKFDFMMNHDSPAQKNHQHVSAGQSIMGVTRSQLSCRPRSLKAHSPVSYECLAC